MMKTKQALILTIAIIISTACSIMAVISNTKTQRLLSKIEDEQKQNSEAIAGIIDTTDTIADKVDAIENSNDAPTKENAGSKELEESVLDCISQISSLKDKLQQLEQQLKTRPAEEQAATAVTLKELSAKLEIIQEQLTKQAEADTAINTIQQEDIEKIKTSISEVSKQVKNIEGGGVTYVSYSYNDTYESHNYYESTAPNAEEKEDKEDDQPEHTHTFDVYGNCTDVTCSVHQETEVFSQIYLLRGKANEDYYYHIAWEGDLNFEIVYAYASTDDVEITLFSDEEHLCEVPMERIDAVYTAAALEAGIYYIQVLTLTDGDVDISIY